MTTAIVSKVALGNRLPNGAILIAKKAWEVNVKEAIVVLALFHGEYVTWISDIRGYECVWGHYFDNDFAAAAADFQKR